MLIALIAVSWCLFNLIVSLVFATANGDQLDLRSLPLLFAMMILTPVPVYIMVQIHRQNKKQKNAAPRKKGV